uniref:Uncharacterized protein n=1 Tax=Aegilops tauschii subsp. strangulata TaxID=200361 RepID=A0A453I828_AEGTS
MGRRHSSSKEHHHHHQQEGSTARFTTAKKMKFVFTSLWLLMSNSKRGYPVLHQLL